MNRLLDDTDPSDRSYAGRRQSSSDSDQTDREISLGTPTILGIFFALALVCACFFGFGYAMGRKSAQSAGVPFQPALVAGIGSPKPTAGQPGQPAPSARSTDSNGAASSVVVPVLPSTSGAGTTVAVPILSTPKKAATPADGAIVGDRIPAATPQPATNNLQPATSFFVQVAAVSSQDVADILLASLVKKGYSVAIHHESQDKLLHVQIGPFPDRKDADAMRNRVLADGFNAIVK